MKTIIYNDKTYKIPKPFDDCFFGREPTDLSYSVLILIVVRSVTMPSFALAIYDTIKGAEHTQNYDLMQKGLDWFSRNFTKQYMILLD